MLMRDTVACEIISWNQFYALCRKLVGRIFADGFAPDLIVAIARGGYVPARVMADFLGVMRLTSLRIEHYRGSHKKPLATVRDTLAVPSRVDRILLVDDVSDTGDTFHLALEKVREKVCGAQIRTAALHHKVESKYEPDYYAEKILQWHWITYPWAVIEDLCMFIKAMDERPGSLTGIAEKLYGDHGIRVALETLEEAMRTLEKGLW